jgi:hypothetical protein
MSCMPGFPLEGETPRRERMGRCGQTSSARSLSARARCKRRGSRPLSKGSRPLSKGSQPQSRGSSVHPNGSRVHSNASQPHSKGSQHQSKGSHAHSKRSQPLTKGSQDRSGPGLGSRRGVSPSSGNPGMHDIARARSGFSRGASAARRMWWRLARDVQWHTTHNPSWWSRPIRCDATWCVTPLAPVPDLKVLLRRGQGLTVGRAGAPGWGLRGCRIRWRCRPGSPLSRG